MKISQNRQQQPSQNVSQLRFTNTSQAAWDMGIKTLVFGGTGAGKTALAASCPRPCIITTESRLLTLKGYDIPSIVAPTYQDVQEAHEWLKGSHEAKGFDTYILDGISDVAETGLYYLNQQHKDKRQAFYALQQEIINMVKAFRNLPRHVYMTGKMGSVLTADGAIKGSILSPNKMLSQALPYEFDEVFYLKTDMDVQTKTVSRWLQTQPDFQYDCKDSSGVLAPFEPFVLADGVNSGLGAIFSKITA